MPQAKITRVLDALPDTIDFRDKMYVPPLVEVAPTIPLDRFLAVGVPVLDQGVEGACTGFGLATVVNYLLRMQAKGATADEVSARMLYAMAKRYDEWPGEEYEGSSARGAMKGWHKHGVCAAKLFKEAPAKERKPTGKGAAKGKSKSAAAVAAKFELNPGQTEDALRRPLGAYFRVNHKDLVSMHTAITEVGVLYGTAVVHQGWMDVRPGDKEIVYSRDQLGGHAFAIVAYDSEGFWIQNSWGAGWGRGGFARIGYSDWLENSTDVWVARLGAPVTFLNPAGAALMRAGAPQSYESFVYAQLRPHIITLENDGKLREKGAYGLTPAGLRDIIRNQLPAKVAGWKKKRVVLYAHGGLVSEESALQQAANLRGAAIDAEVYPIAFIWRSDLWTTIGNILQDAFRKRRDEGVLDAAKDFLFDRIDDTIEPLARTLGGKALWDEMKENATFATAKANGGARAAANHIADAKAAGQIDEIHLAGHSAGSIFMAALAPYLVQKGVKIASLSLWAPAITMELFKQTLWPLIQSGDIAAFDLYTLDDATERDDDCAHIYHKSLLYLVSGAFEERARIPWIRPNGTALLGLARDVDADPLKNAFGLAKRRWIIAPGNEDSKAHHHGDFDNDEPTLRSTLRRITAGSADEARTQSVVTPSRAATAKARNDLNKVLRLQP